MLMSMADSPKRFAPMLKYLRIAVTALCLTACMLLTALWVRSYRWVDVANGPRLGSRIVTIGSTPGVLCIAFPSVSISWIGPWDRHSFNVNWREGSRNDGTQIDTLRIWGTFAYENANRGVYIPYWFGVFISATAATIPWISWSRRFSLRTLLIATTLVAVGMGAVVFLAR
jgi:hypothetical protein